MGEMITLKVADGHTLSAYRAGPEGATKSLVVVQEIFCAARCRKRRSCWMWRRRRRR
jgi:hypothetical protein